MEESLSRFGRLIGEDGLDKLAKSTIAVFGIGGVGGHCALSLARAGVGHLVLVDHDVVTESNINRQEVADYSTIGQVKVDVMAKKIRNIRPTTIVEACDTFFLPGEESSFDFAHYDYVIDCVDNIAAKVALAKICTEQNIPLISAMGAGNKLHPEMLKVADIYETSICPLAKIMRGRLRKEGIPKLKVVYSLEEPIQTAPTDEILPKGKKTTPGSSPFVPAAMGLLLASNAINDLLGIQ